MNEPTPTPQINPRTGSTSGRVPSKMVMNAREAWERAQRNAWLKWEGKLMGRVTAAANVGELTCRVSFASIKLRADDAATTKFIVSQLAALGFSATVEESPERRNSQGRVVAGNSIVIDFSAIK